MMRTAMFMAMTALLFSTAPRAEESSYLPGGEEVRKLVETRRGKTELSRLAASMKAGTWAELKAQAAPGMSWSSPKVLGGRNNGGTGGLHIAGWTNDAHWDSRTGQFFYMGIRQTRRFVAYSEEKNQWRSIELDQKSDNPVFFTNTGHIYGTNAFDPERSRFYHYYRSFKSEKYGVDAEGGTSYFDALTEKWTKLPAGPGGMAFEYFSAMDGLVNLSKRPQIFSIPRQKWEPLGGESPVDGYHSVFRHNPYRNELLMAGGNNSPQAVARIKKDGTIERLKDAPEALSVRGSKLIVDPLSGRYLIKDGGRCFEFDSDANEYREFDALVSGYPYGHYAMPVCTFIPEYGVIMWAEPTGTYLYKHDSSAWASRPKGDGKLNAKETK